MSGIVILSDLWLPFPGGAERYVFNLARDLHERGLPVRAVTGYENAKAFDGALVLSYLNFTEDDAGGERCAEVIASMEPDLLVIQHFYAFCYRDQLERLGVPTVQLVHNRERLRWARLAIFSSDFTRRRLYSMYDDLVAVPPAFARDLGDTPHGPAIGFVKPIKHKGVELVYEIAQRMPARPFVILRGEWQDIEIIRDDLPNVTYLEPVDDMRDFYRHVDRVLVPSLSEDAGTIGQECAVLGIPCISTDVGGLPETNGGVLLTTRNPAEWEATIRVLDDPELYAGVVERQREHMAGWRAQWETAVGAITALYEEVRR